MFSGNAERSGHSVTQSGRVSILPAQSDYVEIGRFQTDHQDVWLIVEKQSGIPSHAQMFWGQHLSIEESNKVLSEISGWALQSCIVTQHKASGAVEVIRNHHATCPLYLLAKGNVLFFHWDPVALYSHIEGCAPLNIEACIAFLTMRREYGCETVFRDIFLLPERGRAVFDDAGLRIIKPQHIDPSLAVSLKEGVDPVGVFINIVKSAVDRLDGDKSLMCAELSSGLDTTLVINMLAELLGAQEPIRTFGYCMMDVRRDGIKAMRQETLDKLSIIDVYEPIENYFRDAFSLSHGRRWPYQTQTDFEKRRFAKIAANHGKTAVLTGIGGDELCMLTADERASLGIAPQPIVYIEGETEGFSVMPKEMIHHASEFFWPNGYVADSAPDMANSSDFLYIREGVWPFHPLTLAEIHSFTRFLPMEWRRKRRLSREALLRLGYSDYFVKQDPKERLSDTMAALLCTVDWGAICKNAAVFDFGLVDREKLFDGVHLFQVNKSPDVGISLLTALELELSLQSLGLPA